MSVDFLMLVPDTSCMVGIINSRLWETNGINYKTFKNLQQRCFSKNIEVESFQTPSSGIGQSIARKEYLLRRF
jgi:hypothetical protein